MKNRVRATLLLTAIVIISGIVSGTLLAAEVAPGVQVHGYMQNRFYSAPGSTGQFRSERISISSSAALPNNSNAYVELYYHPWATNQASGIYLESAYYESPLGEGKIRIGKGRRMTFGITPSYPNRKTSNYGLVGEAMTQDRAQGIQYMYQKGELDFGIMLQTAYRIGVRYAGEVPGDTDRNVTHQVGHLSFRDAGAGGGSPSRYNSKLGVSTRLGGKWKGGLKAGASLYLGKLDDEDLKNLRGDTGFTLLRPRNPLAPSVTVDPLLPGTTDTTQRVWGIDLTYQPPSGFVFTGEYFDAEVSELEYKAWYATVGYVMPKGWKMFARYGRQDMDTPITNNPLTWDTRQLSISLVQPLNKGLWLQYEWERNSENSGNGNVKNDIFFVELFSGF